MCDLIFLQEVVGYHRKHSAEQFGHDSQFEYLADKLWDHYAYSKNAVYETGHHGNVILSRYPIESWDTRDISTNRFESRKILYAKVNLMNKQGDGKESYLHCFCVHLDLTHRGRKRQYDILCKEVIEKCPDQDDKIIIAGDFNDWNRKSGDFLGQRLGAIEAFSKLSGKYAKTFPAKLPVLPLDRIYTKNLQVTGGTVLKGKTYRMLSDHRPILCELELYIEARESRVV